MKFKILLVSTLVVAAVAGCKRKAADESVAVPQPPPPNLPASGAPSKSDTGNDFQMAQSNCAVLTLALQTYMGNNAGRAPADVNELVRVQQLRAVPSPPVGWRYSIDVKNKQVVLSKQ